MEVEVVAPSRLHFGLIDLNGGLGRVDGGFGLALNDPKVSLKVRRIKSEGIEVVPEGFRDGSLKKVLEGFIQRLGLDGGFRIEFEESTPAHVGLGSTTQHRLSAAAGICSCAGKELSIKEYAAMMGRGGTSGIGAKAFKSGGFIVDGGHSFGPEGEKVSFTPSSASNASPPPVLFHKPFPKWSVILAIPEVSKGLHGQPEKSFFEEVCPLPEGEADRLCRVLLMKLLPSIVLEDLDEFDQAVGLTRGLGFKRLEIENQDSVVLDVINDMERYGGRGVSMSSFGPTVFAFTEDVEKGKQLCEKLIKGGLVGEVLLTQANNIGAQVK